jgi:radical SAM protein with 4Fe4S-binding SPASM domain
MQRLLSATRDVCNFARTLSLRKLINYVKLHASYYFSVLIHKPVHAGLPASLSIEPTTSCNLRCPECPSGLKEFTRPQGKMAEIDFENIIDQLKGQLMVVMLYFQGEPLLNPELFKMLAYARKKHVYTSTSTNGHFLNDENARELVESGLNRLIISVDGTRQETYEKYRRDGKLDEVLIGIRNMIKWKRELQSSRPFLIIQFLVLKHNEHQIPEIKKLAKELGVKLELKTAQVYNFREDTDLIPADPKYARYVQRRDRKWELKKAIRNRCFRMWSGAVITWDGKVVPCCFDKDANHQLGKLDNHFFVEIWKSKAYKDFRKQVFTDRSKIAICGNCSE